MKTTRTHRVAAIVCGLLLAAASRAAADPGQSGPGPLVLTPIPRSVVFAPDFQATRINGTIGTLGGVYVGELWDNHLFAGVGGYWLINPRNDVRMGYAGFIAGWQFWGDKRVSIGLKSLFGAGQATVFTSL